MISERAAAAAALLGNSNKGGDSYPRIRSCGSPKARHHAPDRCFHPSLPAAPGTTGDPDGSLRCSSATTLPSPSWGAWLAQRASVYCPLHLWEHEREPAFYFRLPSFSRTLASADLEAPRTLLFSLIAACVSLAVHSGRFHREPIYSLVVRVCV